MKYATKFGCSLVALLLFAGFASTVQAQRTVTLRLNMATLSDTIDAADEIEVRGCLKGCSDNASELPDGNTIAWDDRTTLLPTNVGGDYWELSFQIPDGDSLDFKFFSAQSENWESGGNHLIPAGTEDTTLVLHYFEQSDQTYEWRPWTPQEDSVTVWFRVYGNTSAAVAKGYDGSQTLGVRGAPDNGSALDWNDAGTVPLARESTDDTQVGYYLYSGAITFPDTAIGNTQPYKFYIMGIGENAGWEGSSDRTFSIPAQDSTLHWALYSNSPPLTGEDPVTSDVRFVTDVSPLEQVGVFDEARGDTMIVLGDFNGYTNCLDGGNPDDCLLDENTFGNYDANISVRAVPNTTMNYKFFVDFEAEGLPAGWEEPLDWGGGDRSFMYTGDGQDLGVQYYNDIRPDNVIPAGEEVEVTFQVRMDSALAFDVRPTFDPETDSVRVGFQDPVWILTQTQNKEVEALDQVTLSDDDGDMVYTGTYTVVGPTYNGIGFAYEYGTTNTGFTIEGSGGFGSGRRRYQYILPDNGTWPSSYTMPLADIQADNPLRFECNPTADVSSLPESVTSLCYEAGAQPGATGIERVGDGIPTQITLGGNYPNPFGSTTTFEYTIDRPQQVTLRVYDVLGRTVRTLVDERQAANTYRVGFDASDLSSGVYIYQLRTPQRTLTRKMLLVK